MHWEAQDAPAVIRLDAKALPAGSLVRYGFGDVRGFVRGLIIIFRRRIEIPCAPPRPPSNI